MAPLYTTLLQRGPCPNGPMCTPPESPDLPSHHLKRQASQVQLPRFYRKTQPTRSPTFLARALTMQKISTKPSLDNLFKIAQCSNPPFRTVKHMKEPFQLRLPSSPALSEQGSNSDSASWEKTPASKDHCAQQKESPLEIRAPQPTVLLPNPLFSEDMESRAESYSNFINPRSAQPSTPQKEIQRTTYEEQYRIVSSYCDHPKSTKVLEDSPKRQPLSAVNSTPGFMPQATVPSIVATELEVLHSPGVEPRNRKRSTTCSSEAKWFSGEMSECEPSPQDSRESNRRCAQWLQNIPSRRDRRRYQVLQHRSGAEQSSTDYEDHQIVGHLVRNLLFATTAANRGIVICDSSYRSRKSKASINLAAEVNGTKKRQCRDQQPQDI